MFYPYWDNYHVLPLSVVTGFLLQLQMWLLRAALTSEGCIFFARGVVWMPYKIVCFEQYPGFYDSSRHVSALRGELIKTCPLESGWRSFSCSRRCGKDTLMEKARGGLGLRFSDSLIDEDTFVFKNTQFQFILNLFSCSFYSSRHEKASVVTLVFIR